MNVMQFQPAYFCSIKKNLISRGSFLLLYCVEINKGADGAPAVRVQPPFTGRRWELYTNIRYERRLCHEYRAGLEAGRLIMWEKVGMRDLGKNNV